MTIHATCKCTAPIMVRGGAVVCASCGAAVVGAPETTAAEVSTYRLPVDAKTADAFNRACRSGTVTGAAKRGRAWVCTLDAWNARKRSAPSNVPTRSKAPARLRVVTPVDTDAAVLAELGLASPKRTG